MHPQINSNFNLEKELAEQNPVKDWMFGSASQLGIVNIPIKERPLWLPFGETQFDMLTDFFDCASRSPVNHYEGLFTYHFHHGMKPENQQWCHDQGLVVIRDGKEVIEFSDRYIAILSGTTKSGNSLKAPLETIRTKGLIPKAWLPKQDDLTWEQYMDPNNITQTMLDFGKELLRRFTISYEQVQKAQFADALQLDMLGVAGYAWPIPHDGVYPAVPSGGFNHAFLLYDVPQWQAYDNYYDYDNEGHQIFGDFTKNLAPDYFFWDWGYRAYIGAENVVSPIEDLPQEQQVSIFKWLSDVITWLFTNKQGPMPAYPSVIMPTPAPTPTPVVDKNKLLQAMCLAIKAHEGWYIGSVSYRNNNPGNCRYSSLGYLPIYEPVERDSKNFAVFKDYATGWLYLQNLILNKAKRNLNQNLYQFFAIYAPEADNNDPEHYAEVVATKMGVSPSTWQMKNLL